MLSCYESPWQTVSPYTNEDCETKAEESSGKSLSLQFAQKYGQNNSIKLKWDIAIIPHLFQFINYNLSMLHYSFLFLSA